MKYSIAFFFLLILFSCSSPNKKLSSKDEFDKLEKIFSSANWRITEGADTAYWYFSRLGDLNYTVYDYTIKEGDSSLHEVSHISYLNNIISWVRLADTLKLVSLDSSTAVWHSIKEDQPAYSFKKLSDSSVSVDLPGGKQLSMKKTLSLTPFLVRSKYDHLHHTHTVESPEVPHRGKPLQ